MKWQKKIIKGGEKGNYKRFLPLFEIKNTFGDFLVEDKPKKQNSKVFFPKYTPLYCLGTLRNDREIFNRFPTNRVGFKRDRLTKKRVTTLHKQIDK